MAVQTHELLQLNCFMRMCMHKIINVTSPDSCHFSGLLFLLLQMTVNKLFFNSGIGAMWLKPTKSVTAYSTQSQPPSCQCETKFMKLQVDICSTAPDAHAVSCLKRVKKNQGEWTKAELRRKKKVAAWCSTNFKHRKCRSIETAHFFIQKD